MAFIGGCWRTSGRGQAMPIPNDCWLVCLRCGELVDVADNEVGDVVHCAACGWVMVVDAVPEPPPTPPAAASPTDTSARSS